MPKKISTLIFTTFVTLFIAFANAQEKKPIEPPKTAMNSYQELMIWWYDIGKRLIAMSEDFPEDKYNYKAQKDERTFGDNLRHVASGYYTMINIIKGSTVGYTEDDDSLRKKYPTKTDIVSYLKQSVIDGADLINAQGDSGLTHEVKYPWGNQMVHASYCWWTILWHAGDHYGQLAVYYRLNGLIPPASRPRK